MEGKKKKITLCLYAYSITEVAPFEPKFKETAKEVVIHLNEQLFKKGNLPDQCWFLYLGTKEERIFASYPEMKGSPFYNELVSKIEEAEERNSGPDNTRWQP